VVGWSLPDDSNIRQLQLDPESATEAFLFRTAISHEQLALSLSYIGSVLVVCVKAFQMRACRSYLLSI